MQELDFYELSRAVQDRLIASVAGQGQPAPLLGKPAGPAPGVPLWGGAVGAGVLALIVLYHLGLGDLESGLAIHQAPLIAGYAVALATTGVAILQVASRVHARWSLPFAAGVYLFPSGVIDACTHKLRVFPLSGATVVLGGQNFGLTFADGASFSFPVSDPARLPEMKSAIEEAQATLERAHATGDKKHLGLLDPLVDVGVANPFAPTSRMSRNLPAWARFGWVIGIAVGGALAPGVWWMRNRSSDASLLTEANRRRSVAGYQAYLARGGSRIEVRDVLLPRAELVDAVKEGTVEAIEAYIAAHPTSSIRDEVMAALRQTMLVALETVKRAGTVSALTEFGKRHPHHLVDAELKQAIHGVYQAALAKYRKESGVKDAGTISFVDRLLAVVERTGPKVEIRFRRKINRTMDLADMQIKKSPFFQGNPSIPSQYFDEAHARARETTAAKAIAARFASMFPADVLSLEMGPPIVDPDGALPASTVPTMFIEHTSQVSGPSYLSAKPRGVFVGLSLLFETTFRLPDDPSKPHRFKLPLWRNPETKVEKGDEPTIESAIYEAMTGGAFNQFTSKYLTTFFGKSDAND